MDYILIKLRRKELRRLREIINGRAKTDNTFEEDKLLREGLVKKRLLVKINGSEAEVFEPGVVPTDDGKKYLALYDEERKKRWLESRRYFISTVIAIAGIVISIWLTLCFQ